MQNPTPSLPRRADARRNSSRVLQAAIEVFDAHGTEVTLEQIAKAAGVGVGTVYRHFPSKTVLLQAAVLETTESLLATARSLARQPNATAALFALIRAIGEQGRVKRALIEALLADGQTPNDAFARAKRALDGELQGILRHAQQQGGVRADVTAADVRALLAGCIMASANISAPAKADGRIMLDIICDGLRIPAPPTA